jgi:hypothetical protein
VSNAGEQTEICPECDAECTNVDMDTFGDGDPDSYGFAYTFLCPYCGCAFERIVRTEVEVEVTKHGNTVDEDE